MLRERRCSSKACSGVLLPGDTSPVIRVGSLIIESVESASCECRRLRRSACQRLTASSGVSAGANCALPLSTPQAAQTGIVVLCSHKWSISTGFSSVHDGRTAPPGRPAATKNKERKNEITDLSVIPN
jgi:hypothetical protein